MAKLIKCEMYKKKIIEIKLSMAEIWAFENLSVTWWCTSLAKHFFIFKVIIKVKMWL